MDAKLRILERQAQIEDNWEAYARALERAVAGVDEKDKVYVWVALEFKEDWFNIGLDIYATETEAKGHILKRYMERAGTIDNWPLPIEAGDEFDPKQLADIHKFDGLLKRDMFDEAWELWFSYDDELIEGIPTELFGIERHEIGKNLKGMGHEMHM